MYLKISFNLLPTTDMTITREAFIKAVENNSTTKQLREVADKYGYVC
ncbi:MAG: hypothetical protein J6W16_03775 [Methanobrevibacter sp.]|nr:hypothetical protein [Methanobrevibacter sp.]